MSSERSPREVNLRPQPWRWGHPRVLIEHPDEGAGLSIASALRFAGYAVTVCPGPRGRGQCPLIGPEGCAPAHDADLVVGCLGYEREAAAEVLGELRMRYPNLPLVVETPSDADADLRGLLDGCDQLPAPATPEQIVAAVQTLIGLPDEEAAGGA